jgi:4-hydroxythreonine-4-phosphate dehydrogenase
MRSAIYAAMDIKRNREADDEAKQNPLPKLYHERREDSERSRHTLPQEKAE